jgi:HD-GYP domain-containing protein (c-di-GMP phosphodiesterase class II)
MRRTVLFEAASRAAATAASQLGDGYRTVPLADAAPAEPATVVLAGTDAPLPAASEQRRIVALLAGGAADVPADGCYAVLPAGASPAAVRRAIDNAFSDLEARGEIAKLRRELRELNAIGIRLSSERDPVALMELILTKAREITASDAGSLYIVQPSPDGGRELAFVLAQNDSVELSFRAATLPLDSDSVAGHVALSGERVNLPDAYALPDGTPFRINRSYDEQTGYRTCSMLVVPMRTPKGETLGVLQLINCKPDHRGPLRGPDDAARHVKPFGARFEALAESLASQAAVALENNRLYESIRRLFEGFVAASVTAIESRDPTTSGHSFRVAMLTLGLAEAVDRCQTGPHARTRFNADEMRELRYAAVLHDFGKVGVREDVLLKAKKLYAPDLERIRQRVALVKRGLELRIARRKVEILETRGRRGFAGRAAALDAELAASLAELDAAMASILRANEPTVLTRDVAAQIEALAARTFEDVDGTPLSILSAAEAHALAIARGSLTAEEIAEIRSHVRHTWSFLTQIPWTGEFRRVPEIARSHHEKLDGSGYPDGIRGDAIPVQSRMLTIADIYDALTAADRPYKAAVPLGRALDILDAECRAGAIDSELLDLFVEARVFERTARR